MPFPLLPLVGIAVSGSLVAFGVKTAQKRRAAANHEKNKTFSKYAQDHRVREKVETALKELKTLKEEVQLRELSRFSDIFENILHSGTHWSSEKFQDEDYSPIITSAPMREISAIGGAVDWSISGIRELQKQLRMANDELTTIVLRSGFDFNTYTYREKGTVLRAVNLASCLNKALNISLVDPNGNFRDNSIDEIEELLTDTFEKAA